MTKIDCSQPFKHQQLHRHRLVAGVKAGHDIIKAYDKHESIAYWELCDKGFGMDEVATDKFMADIAKETDRRNFKGVGPQQEDNNAN